MEDDAQLYFERAERLLQLAAVTQVREERRGYLVQSAEWRERGEALKAKGEAEGQ
jgi:hypothetical protein